MTEISPVEFARDAFEKRDQRFVLTRACVGFVLLNAVVLAAIVALTWPAWGEFAKWYMTALHAARSSGAPPALPAVLGTIGLSVAPFYLLGFVLFAAFEAACLRWLVRNERGGGLLGLTLGADTWRVWAGYWVWLALLALFVAAVVCFYVALNMIGNLIAGPLHLIVLLVAALAPIGWAALLIWGATVFAPASVTSIALRKFAFFNAPKVSRGRIWPLIGAFVIVIGGYLAISSVTSMLIRIPIDAAVQPIIYRALAGGDAKALLPELASAFSTPAVVAAMIVYAVWVQVLACVFYVACFGVNARAARAARDDGKIATASA